jgi:hypothetical protein
MKSLNTSKQSVESAPWFLLTLWQLTGMDGAVLIVSLPLIDSDFKYVRVHPMTQLDHESLPTDFVALCRSPLHHHPNEQVSTLSISESKMFVE